MPLAEQCYKVAPFEHLNAFRICVLLQRVEIAPDCTRKDGDILRDDGDAGSEIFETQSRDINPVDTTYTGSTIRRRDIAKVDFP